MKVYNGLTKSTKRIKIMYFWKEFIDLLRDFSYQTTLFLTEKTLDFLKLLKLHQSITKICRQQCQYDFCYCVNTFFPNN